MQTLRPEVLEISDQKTGRCLYEIKECGIELPKMVIDCFKKYLRFTAADVDELNEAEKNDLVERVFNLEHEINCIYNQLAERGIELED